MIRISLDNISYDPQQDVLTFILNGNHHDLVQAKDFITRINGFKADITTLLNKTDLTVTVENASAYRDPNCKQISSSGIYQAVLIFLASIHVGYYMSAPRTIRNSSTITPITLDLPFIDVTQHAEQDSTSKKWTPIVTVEIAPGKFNHSDITSAVTTIMGGFCIGSMYHKQHYQADETQVAQGIFQFRSTKSFNDEKTALTAISKDAKNVEAVVKPKPPYSQQQIP